METVKNSTGIEFTKVLVVAFHDVFLKIKRKPFEPLYAQTNMARKYAFSSCTMCAAHILSKFVTRPYL